MKALHTGFPDSRWFVPTAIVPVSIKQRPTWHEDRQITA